MTLEELKAIIEFSGDAPPSVAKPALPNALALIEEMAEALQFYADDSEYLTDQGMWDMATSPIDRDRGRKAADTLTRYEAFKADVTAKVGGE